MLSSSLFLLSPIVMQIFQLLLGLSILVALHEFGHYFFARLFKTRVEKFYLFFDFLFPFSNVLPFALFKKKIGETEYGLGWFPLGGYVKIAGMVDESMDKDQLALPPQPWEFRSKKAWQRLFIMLGGIIVNVLLAIFIFAMVLFKWGEKKLPMSELKNGLIITDSLAYQLGFQNQDKIVAINGQPVKYYDGLMAEMIYAKDVEVLRNGQPVTLEMPVNFIEKLIKSKNKTPLFSPSIPVIVGSTLKGSPAEAAGLQKEDFITAINGVEVANFFAFKDTLQHYKGQDIVLSFIRNKEKKDVTVHVSDSGSLGFMNGGADMSYLQQIGYYNFETKTFGFFESFPAGCRMAIDKLDFYVKQFKLIFTPSTGAYKGVGGFYSMTKIYPDEWDWRGFWMVTGFLSIVLAFMNLLPIPGLDGGYVLFLLLEMIGIKFSDKVMEVVTTIGLVLLLLLMFGANIMDIIRPWLP